MAIRIGIVVTRSGSLRLRQEPSTSSPILRTLPKGFAMQILRSEGDWYHVSVGDLQGYVWGALIHIQDDGPQATGLRSLIPDFDRESSKRMALVQQALRMLGEDTTVFDNLPEVFQKCCCGWNYRHDLYHLHHKDIVCADLVYICLKAAGIREIEWTVDAPQGTSFKSPHAANYFRPNEFLRKVADNEPWQAGDILIYWNGDLESNRLRHVNLYVGPFSGVDLDGRVYPKDKPCDVVNASIDYRDRGRERGTRIMGLTKERCLITKLGRKNTMRLRHIEIEKGFPEEAPTIKPLSSVSNDFIVDAGQLTFDAEGQEISGLYFSRRPHVPSNSSGVTLGRGYDLKSKKQSQILADLTKSGLDPELAEKFAGAAGLKGDAANQYILRQGLGNAIITPTQQKALFEITYAEHSADVERICNKSSAVRTYGGTDWEQLHPAIKDILVDLRYRGDYTPFTRKRVQPLVVANDVVGLATFMSDEKYWKQQIGVPRDRFERRADYMAKALRVVG
ncbi:pesticin C-terminus-like muramidase [Desulfoferrobacter suflitae]|uniref:pesticin C-terminus-like muramidase n=1 Tax=Desulfoferrobacter suflitae TaxID=2865782 RepID=UPI002164D306|nr:pesticin C-terminus-like muramidase [Desulfoferrobacter suflitae]MCK8600115.1 pesticin C-terminus-like muramidase [Desulfoferrobacter suflitae]